MSKITRVRIVLQMTNRTDLKNRIKVACSELEEALATFDNDDEADRRRQEEAAKIRELRQTLSEIRKKIDELSH